MVGYGDMKKVWDAVADDGQRVIDLKESANLGIPITEKQMVEAREIIKRVNALIDGAYAVPKVRAIYGKQLENIRLRANADLGSLEAKYAGQH